MPAPSSKRNATVPAWPGLDARQKREALAATWLPRLIEALGGAAALAALTAFASYQVMGGRLGWQAALSAVMAAGFLAAFLFLRNNREPGPWIAPLGLATLAATQLNLINCVIEYLNAQGGVSEVPDPAFLLLAPATGTLWGLRIQLSPEGFAWSAAITATILWLPWVSVSGAPLELCLIGGACITAGAGMRWIGAERAYDVYRRETVWPVLWQKRLDLAVTRELAALGVAVSSEPGPAWTQAREAASVLNLATALTPSLSGADGAEAHMVQESRKADSPA